MKTVRQEKIIELIRQYEIDTQEELAQKLNEAGFKVTQATVSRDIRALKMTKVTGPGGKSRYAILPEPEPQASDLGDKYARVLKEAVISMDAGQNLVVIHTIPGMAMGAGAALDALKWPEILGCIAGDDTILCAARTSAQARHVLEKLEEILGGTPRE
ncbi:MAG: arginine repressor [Clostridiales bacterium]|nr:arginine repressor [Clostridiales bacterium]MCD8154138.1 arginine repressor [Clostridiales bacterium]